jgi:hypothetical protein
MSYCSAVFELFDGCRTSGSDVSFSIPAPDPRRWMMLPVILSATFMALFDGSV